ncbi:sel1 repeat family protein [Pelomyxa schiedti]|nr:sel1 repeat family protein [Pelomyxa schiedti]
MGWTPSRRLAAGTIPHDDFNINTIGKIVTATNNTNSTTTQTTTPTQSLDASSFETTTATALSPGLMKQEPSSSGGGSSTTLVESHQSTQGCNDGAVGVAVEPLPGKALGLVLLRYIYSSKPDLFSHQRPHNEYLLDALLERARSCSAECHRFMMEVLDRACSIKVVDDGDDGGKSRALFCAGHFIKGSLLFQAIGVEEDFRGCMVQMKECERYNFAWAQNTIGLCYETGKGVQKDSVKAFQYYMLAAQQGELNAQRNVGLCYKNGEGVNMDKTEAVRWFKMSSALPISCANLSNCYRNGDGIKKDPVESLRLLKLAAEKGVKTAQCKLAGETSDPVEAFRLLSLAAAQGDAVAQFKVGTALIKGNGVEKNPAEAARFFRMAAAQGVHAAMRALGVMCEEGNGLPRDSSESFRWFRQAADLGYSVAQSDVGWCYYTGTGVGRDFSMAVYWYQKAIDNPKGTASQAHNNLALCYSRGHGVTQNLGEAFRLYRTSAIQGNAFSQFNAALSLEHHNGTPTKDTREAMRWYRLAASRGHTTSIKRLEKIVIQCKP